MLHFPALQAQCEHPLPVLPAGHCMQFFGSIPLQSLAATHSGFAPSDGAEVALAAVLVGVVADGGVVGVTEALGVSVTGGAGVAAGEELPHAARARRRR
jgi:hypothetical protein